ncbi:MAG: VOC family protein [Cytophagales bacterium]|nr:VOC family protein [Armatimonadota bacterium]
MRLSAELKTGHVGINVSDLARSISFYRAVFGFAQMHESQETGREFAFLGDGETLFLTLWQQSQGRFNAHAPGLHHLSFQVPTIADVAEAERRVRSLGAHLYHSGVVPHTEGAQSGGIFFEDPDGTRLEIYASSGAGGSAAPTPGAPTCGFF